MKVASKWTEVYVPFARKGIAHCRRNHDAVRDALKRALRERDNLSWQDQRTVSRVLEQFTPGRAFPMGVSFTRTEWGSLSRALRDSDGLPTSAYNLMVRLMGQLGRFYD